MRFNKLILPLALGFMLVACNNGDVTSFNSEIKSDEVSSSVISQENSSEEELSNGVDYSLFDEEIIGTWYVHQSMMGLAPINEVITINTNYTAFFLGVNFNFVGLYDGFEGTCLFKSTRGTVDFVVGYDGEGNIDWAIVDTQGNQDWGFAKKEEHVSGIQYSYEGTDWPMDKINEFLGTDGELPVFEHDYYYLYTGISQLYDDIYCMIDLYGVEADARENYTLELENNGYEISKEDPTFYTGFDSTHTFTIRLKQYEDNLCIFVYYYDTFYKN